MQLSTRHLQCEASVPEKEIRFRDRRDAGQVLAESLAPFADRDDVIVLALPRGGVPVAHEVAKALRAPLDVFVVRKVGVPGHEELALGAIASGGIRVVDSELAHALRLTEQDIETLIAHEQRELERREAVYRQDRPTFPELRDKTVILVDDGLATGSTMRAAALALRAESPAQLVIAVPVAPPETCLAMREVADAVVCARTPEAFYAVGVWYRHFDQTTDAEVRELLMDADHELRAGAATDDKQSDTTMEHAVTIHDGRLALEGTLTLPRERSGVVLFAHGSGSSRHSPRNHFVAEQLQHAGFATLLLDLLTAEEEAVDARTRAFRFDIALLAKRVVLAVDWLEALPETRTLPLGLFGASTGAAAALVAAAARPTVVNAVVSRGGRPDLAGEALHVARAPTLLIVGAHDDVVLELNEQAISEMRAPAKLVVVPGATHLFEERGALKQVARLAAAWFDRHLAGVPIDGSASSSDVRELRT
jgi:putative phosphoribosyl transferase